MTVIREKQHVVIVGAGFAGVQVARGLGAAGVRATLLDRQNYHLFQPLLYQVATAALSPADIAEPVRRMMRRFPSVEVLLGEVTGLDVAARRVALADGKSLSYDILVLAAGATHAYFGHDEWAEFGPSMKSIADARRVRSRLLLSFEQAEMSDNPAERKRLMTFVVIGGGPSGVELAGAIIEANFPTIGAMLLQGKADVVSLVPPFNYAPDVEKGAHTLFTMRDGMGASQMIVLVARKEFLEKNRAALDDFFSDMVRGIHWMLKPAHRNAAIALVSRISKQPASLYEPYWLTKKDEYRDPNGVPDLAALRRNIDTQVKFNFLKHRIDVTKYADLSFIERAAKHYAKEQTASAN